MFSKEKLLNIRVITFLREALTLMRITFSSHDIISYFWRSLSDLFKEKASEHHTGVWLTKFCPDRDKHVTYNRMMTVVEFHTVSGEN